MNSISSIYDSANLQSSGQRSALEGTQTGNPHTIMKQILTTTLLAFALVSTALAQGQITFNATGAQSIRYSLDGELSSAVAFPAGNPATIPWGNLNIALYGAPLGTPLNLRYGMPDLTGPWKMQLSPVLQQLAAPGVMTGKIVQMPPSVLDPAGNLQLTVVAWTGTAPDFMSALLWNPGLLAWSGERLSGGALSWASGSGSATTPYVITKGANAFNGLVLAPIIPEPSSFALAGLGAAAVLVSRRRK
jgi:hypothetical protein